MATATIDLDQGDTPPPVDQGDTPPPVDQGDTPGPIDRGDTPGPIDRGDTPGPVDQGDTPGPVDQGDTPPPPGEESFILRDGRRVRIRAIRATDAEGLVEFHSRLSPGSRELRFHRPKPRLGRWEAEYLAGVDHCSRTALVATVIEDGQERIVADARLDLTEPGWGEGAFVVRDDHQGAGLGGELVARITGIARSLGVARLSLLVLSGNTRMLQLAERAGACRLGGDGPASLLVIRTGTEDIRVRAA